MPTHLHIDIETLPALHWTPEERLRYAYSKVPKTYSKPASIAKWLGENAEEQWRRTALDPAHGQIWYIGCAVDDSEPIIEYKMTGLAMLEEHIRHIREPVWVGKSIRAFDLPWLAQHALLEGYSEIAAHLVGLLAYPYDKRVQDVSELWPTGPGRKFAPSLDPMAAWLGLPGKLDGMHGSKVYDAYLEDRGDEVAAYCAQDIRSTRMCWRVLRGDVAAAGGVRTVDFPELPEEVAALLEVEAGG